MWGCGKNSSNMISRLFLLLHPPPSHTTPHPAYARVQCLSSGYHLPGSRLIRSYVRCFHVCHHTYPPGSFFDISPVCFRPLQTSSFYSALFSVYSSTLRSWVTCKNGPVLER
ncbi:hypothetical protein B0T24DRAFT_372596 [Lasiosphaeria ovina]|uniref:Secreted protein n=1 Tax=Lasiosphaeria ovina TaxID=92902 RepID=A0AAE0JYZ6_9PEZI|nr:hypothetical protein B0T24DRAFT_372596 [Lasiosphaeria ovina]